MDNVRLLQPSYSYPKNLYKHFKTQQSQLGLDKMLVESEKLFLWWRNVQTLLKADLPISSFHYWRKLK
jgi:hypothetical protein